MTRGETWKKLFKDKGWLRDGVIRGVSIYFLDGYHLSSMDTIKDEGEFIVRNGTYRLWEDIRDSQGP